MMVKRLSIAIVLVAACGGNNNTMTDAAHDAAGDAMRDALPTTVITGSAFHGFIDGSGSGQFGLETVVAVTSASLNGSALVAEDGTYDADGTYSVPVVKGDTTYTIGYQPLDDFATYVAGDMLAPNFTTITWEDPSTLVLALDPTATVLDVSGMAVWGAIDDMEMLDPANGAVVFSPYSTANCASPTSSCPGAPIGKTTFDGTFDWPEDEQLLHAGDVVDVWQLHTAGIAGNQYAAISNVGTLTAPVQTDGSAAPVTLTVKMTALTQNETLAIDFKHDEFAALGSQVGSGATDDVQQDLVIDAAPFASSTGPLTSSSTPDLVEWGIESAIPAGSDVLQTFHFANPFTLTGLVGGTALQPFVILNYLFDVTVSGTPFVVGVTEFLSTDSLGSGTVTLAPNVSPVTGVMVNGQAIDGAAGVGADPTISWTAPTIGTVTGYSVTLTDVGSAEDFSGGTVYTEGTSVQLPPGLISTGSGNSYVATITAYVAPNWDITATPLIAPLPLSECSMVTGAFQP
jgi:hypothetical protein